MLNEQMTGAEGKLKAMIKKLAVGVLATLVSTVTLQLLSLSKSTAKELDPDSVIQAMYSGVAHIHGGQAVPRIYRPIPAGTRTGCGRMPAGNAFYCKRDHSIYVSTDMVRIAYRVGGDAALAYVIGHEYAHAMQHAFGFNNRGGVLTELQADCLAGLYMKAVPNLVFDRSDIQEVNALAYKLGDFAPVWDRNHHGTPSQRVKAVMIGLNAKSWRACAVR